jgi:hypothetical protein
MIIATRRRSYIHLRDCIMNSGAVIAGAQVTILDQSTGLKRDSSTDSTGQYRVGGLPIGNYSVRVLKEGFQTQVREGITLTSAFSVAMNFSGRERKALYG